MSDEITWDQVFEEEEISEDDIKNAESSGRPPVGKYLVEVESSKPRQVNPDGKESFFTANLKLKILDVVEINKVAVSGDEGDRYIGRFIFDDIRMPQAGEKDVFRNRRIMIAKRAGIISNNSQKIPGNCWSELIIGKQFLVEVEENRYYSEKKKQDVVNTQVGMFGYESPEAAAAVSDDDLKDI
jgi:hypothetical protein